ncbi:extracellular catalytic domain type 1 short-chain-length polyhydroxyalkanoate depolymerase [Trinickia fusca]|uniref:Esterase n=1 Tax=Trinickia fusca TaxID=2419777 RepID=A0A494XH92_9BURK|nr:PHB depolymerase family esterase [Trinickia fusca]RKP47464.1 esterase [Trinickia fusca]
MTKSLTKLWLRGLKSLMTNLPDGQDDYLRTMTKSPHPPPSDTEPATPRESRVRPRPAAWAKGQWVRSYHSAPPQAGQLVNHLSYGLYLPPGKTARGLPLVVMLHGCKQTIDEFATGTRMNLVADENDFAVVYPEQSKHAHAHRCWHWYDDRDAAGRGEAHAVVSLVEALVDEYGFDGERVYLVGMSAGAGLAGLLALHYPERFAAVGLHSGPALGEAHSGITAMDVMRRGTRHDPIALIDAATNMSAYPGMPAIIVHGEADRVVVLKNAEQLALAFLRLNGFVDAMGAWRAGRTRETRDPGVVTHDHVMEGRSLVRLCQVADLEHAWSGGDEAMPFHSDKGPNASAMLWEFFRDQRRRRRPTAAERPAAARH